MPNHDFLNETLSDYARLTEDNLLRYMDKLTDDSGYEYFKTLRESMQYSLLAGGKRMRPALVYAFCSLFGGKTENAVSYACALEMVHTFSLIHDYMPCMDNDELRRGKPTNHMVFGESCALLAGDALLAYAFEILPSPDLSDRQNLRAFKTLSHLTGPCGMCGGQQIDLQNEGKKIDLPVLQTLHAKKTGALIKCACVLGCIAAGIEDGTAEMQSAIQYAASLGLAFQIADDILDVVGDETKLGKKCGSDQKDMKNTYVTLMGMQKSRALAQELALSARSAVENYQGSRFLYELADYTVNRQS